MRATNSSSVDALLLNATVSGEYSIAATLAFNTVGWESQNILFNTVDALIGSPEVADAFGNEDGAGAKAYLRDTTVEATGTLSVEATAGARSPRKCPTTRPFPSVSWDPSSFISVGRG